MQCSHLRVSFVHVRFAGVLGVDYRLRDITNFLKNEYSHTNTIVAVVEDIGPSFYLIGASTGSSPARKVLKADKQLPCPKEAIEDDGECEAVRVSVYDIGYDNEHEY